MYSCASPSGRASDITVFFVGCGAVALLVLYHSSRRCGANKHKKCVHLECNHLQVAHRAALQYCTVPHTAHDTKERLCNGGSGLLTREPAVHGWLVLDSLLVLTRSSVLQYIVALSINKSAHQPTISQSDLFDRCEAGTSRSSKWHQRTKYAKSITD